MLSGGMGRVLNQCTDFLHSCFVCLWIFCFCHISRHLGWCLGQEFHLYDCEMTGGTHGSFPVITKQTALQGAAYKPPSRKNNPPRVQCVLVLRGHLQNSKSLTSHKYAGESTHITDGEPRWARGIAVARARSLSWEGGRRNPCFKPEDYKPRAPYT